MAPPNRTTSPLRPKPKPAERAIVQQWMGALKSGLDLRKNKVRRIGAKVRMRGYENELKMSVAIDRLLREEFDK